MPVKPEVRLDHEEHGCLPSGARQIIPHVNGVKAGEAFLGRPSVNPICILLVRS